MTFFAVVPMMTNFFPLRFDFFFLHLLRGKVAAAVDLPSSSSRGRVWAREPTCGHGGGE